jgi:membrane protein DedA with SNARE-associated domain
MPITLESIIALFVAHKYAILFPLLVIEGPLVSIIAGFLANPEMGYLNVWVLILVVIIADLVGDVFYYAIGRWGRHSVVFRWVHRLGLSDERFLKLEKHFKNHGGKTIAAGKIGHGIGWAAMLAAGATSMNFLKFLFINFLVSIVKSSLLVFLGYYYGANYKKIATFFHYGGFLLSVILIGAMLIFFYYRRTKTS